MKRLSLVTIMLLFMGITMYAQQAGGSAKLSSAQIKQNAQQSLTLARSNSSQFESTFTSLKAQNTSNNDAAAYKRLQDQIDQLEARIKSEQAKMQAKLDDGLKVSSLTEEQIQRLIDQHKTAMAAMEKFIAN